MDSSQSSTPSKKPVSLNSLFYNRLKHHLCILNDINEESIWGSSTNEYNNFILHLQNNNIKIKLDRITYIAAQLPKTTKMTQSFELAVDKCYFTKPSIIDALVDKYKKKASETEALRTAMDIRNHSLLSGTNPAADFSHTNQHHQSQLVNSSRASLNELTLHNSRVINNTFGRIDGTLPALIGGSNLETSTQNNSPSPLDPSESEEYDDEMTDVATTLHNEDELIIINDQQQQGKRRRTDSLGITAIDQIEDACDMGLFLFNLLGRADTNEMVSKLVPQLEEKISKKIDKLCLALLLKEFLTFYLKNGSFSVEHYAQFDRLKIGETEKLKEMADKITVLFSADIHTDTQIPQ